jgi:LmbE family N-acetylglucosaminyl deacetylase
VIPLKFNKPIDTIVEEIKQRDLNDYLAKNLARFGFYVAPYDQDSDSKMPNHPDHPHTPKK